MDVDSRSFRDAMGCFATGVCVVTCIDSEGRPHGLTINSLSSVSLQPPLLLFSLDRGASCFDAFQACRNFAVNVLKREQIELSRLFASTGEKWNGIGYVTGETGSPILPGCLAGLECRVEQRFDGGDHVIQLGRVLRLHSAAEGEPLLYFRGRYADLR